MPSKPMPCTVQVQSLQVVQEAATNRAQSLEESPTGAFSPLRGASLAPLLSMCEAAPRTCGFWWSTETANETLHRTESCVL